MLDKIEEELESKFKVRYAKDLVERLNLAYCNTGDVIGTNNLENMGQLKEGHIYLEKRAYQFSRLSAPRWDDSSNNIHRKTFDGYLWFGELEYKVSERITVNVLGDDENFTRVVTIRILFPLSAKRDKDRKPVSDRSIEIYSDKTLSNINVLHNLIEDLAYEIELYAQKQFT